MDRKLPTTLVEAVRYFDPETAERYIESIRWPDGPRCPECESANVNRLAKRRRYQCRECRRQFGVMAGTILHDSHLSIDKWCIAAWMLTNCRNGCSSCEIARTVGCRQQSAWHLMHRLRLVITQQDGDKLTGAVEADSTLMGGIVKNMPHRRRRLIERTDWRGAKTIVHAVRDRRTGNVRAEIVGDETTETISGVLAKHLDENACLFTDSAHVYNAARKALRLAHQTVNHHRKEYVRGEVHTNGCESFFNCLRRAAKGTYIRPSPEHLSRYVDEAVYRFNIRRESEWNRFHSAMTRIVGVRLTYSDLTGGATR